MVPSLVLRGTGRRTWLTRDGHGRRQACHCTAFSLQLYILYADPGRLWCLGSNSSGPFQSSVNLCPLLQRVQASFFVHSHTLAQMGGAGDKRKRDAADAASPAGGLAAKKAEKMAKKQARAARLMDRRFGEKALKKAFRGGAGGNVRRADFRRNSQYDAQQQQPPQEGDQPPRQAQTRHGPHFTSAGAASTKINDEWQARAVGAPALIPPPTHDGAARRHRIPSPVTTRP